MKLRKRKRTPEQAFAIMLEHRDLERTGFQGWCLKTCREAWGAPADQPSAIKEWHSIPKERQHKFAEAQAPLAAPVFWSGCGPFGHIALQAIHPDRVISTDAPKTDRVGIVTRGWFETKWGAKLLGWSCELNGVKVITDCPVCDAIVEDE